MKSRWLLVAATGSVVLCVILDRYQILCMTAAVFSSVLFWDDNWGGGSAGDDSGLGVWE